MTSRISKFYQKSPEERLKTVSEFAGLSEEDVKTLSGETTFSINQADRMIENVIGTFPVPLGLATNFKVDDKDVFVPMATEEPSVIAAVSHAAKHAYPSGGFHTSYSGSIVRAQIQVTGLNDPYFALAKIYEAKEELLAYCNEQDPTLVSFGGGAIDLEVKIVRTEREKMVVVHLIVDTKDAMGANTVNTMAEASAPLIERITGGQVVLRILSNLADRRVVRARAVFENPFGDDREAAFRFMDAYDLAVHDPYRATTHNKGIMNGITAAVMATGNDTRAIEAGAHAYAARSGVYQSLTRYELAENGDIHGTIELPLSVGLVGGATQSHPVAKTVTKILNVKTAEELSGIIASIGLAQNFAGLKALATEGIQKGHMKLHARNMASMAGARDNQIDEVLKIAEKEGSYTFDKIKEIVNQLQS